MWSTGGRAHGGRRPTAFTLVELLIVVMLLGVLAAVIIPRVIASAAEAKKTACAQNVANINKQVERWRLEKGTWPKINLSDIGADPEYFPDGIPRCPVDGSQYTLNSSGYRVTGHSH
jgi:prepilin-type N-terminal cleavage/methylation domain-containing protein